MPICSQPVLISNPYSNKSFDPDPISIDCMGSKGTVVSCPSFASWVSCLCWGKD